MEKITSSELEEFKQLVARFEKDDYANSLGREVEGLLDKDYLPRKISGNEFLIEGKLDADKSERIVLRDEFINEERDLHQITAQIDRRQENMPDYYEDRTVAELYGGSTRVTWTQALGRIERAVGPSLVDVISTSEHEFNKDGYLSSYGYKNEKNNTNCSLFINNDKIEIKNNGQNYEFDMCDDALFDKENLSHIPLDIDVLVSHLQAKNDNVK